MSNIVKFQRRVDNFVNLTTGYNTSRDHGVQTTWQIKGSKLTKALADDFHALHELAWKITDTGPLYGLRKWIDYPKLEDDQKSAIEKVIRQTRFRDHLKRALILNNAYGALLYVVLNDGMEQDEPVNYERIRGIDDIICIERGYISPIYSGRTLHHELYQIQTADEYGQTRFVNVHKSRLIRFCGSTVSADWLLQNDGWPPSKLERAYEPLRDLSMGYSLLPNIVKDIIRDVVKLQGLNELAINDCDTDQKAFNDRLDAMFLAQSMINKLVLDKEDEYQRQTTNISGVSDLIRLLERRVVAVSGLPHSYLLGESPGSSIGGQSGESQDRDLNKAVECYQEDEIRPAIEQFMLFVEPIVRVENIEFRFNPLSSQSTEQQANTLKAVSDAVCKLVEAGIISAAEAATVYEGNEVRLIPVLDMEAREAMAELELNEPNEIEEPEEPEEMEPEDGSEENGTQTQSTAESES